MLIAEKIQAACERFARRASGGVTRSTRSTIWRWRRLVLQITMIRGSRCVVLTPSVCITAMNGDLVAGIGLEWFIWTVNLGFARRTFVEREEKRAALTAEYAAKFGVSPAAYRRLRWNGW